LRDSGPHRETGNIARRMRIIYFVIPIFLAVIVFVIGQSLSRNIADDNAMRMSRQYAIEASANFQVFMNPHMRLMQQMAYSTAIARWLSDDYDQNNKFYAFEAMMGHALSWPEAYLMFTAYGTLNAYHFGVDFEFSDFTSWGQVTYGSPASQWFFNTRDGELPFFLNIQESLPNAYGETFLYIWSNHRINYQGQFVGAVTIGSRFVDIYNATFHGFDDYGKRGYIIDQYGAVRVDSAGILEVLVDGLPALPPVPEVCYDPYLGYELANHLTRLEGGEFALGTPSLGAIRLNYGYFRYASIAPIIGTSWSVMVLSGTPAAFDMQYMYLLVIAGGLIVLVVLVGGLFMHRMVIAPIQTAVDKEQRAIRAQQLMYDSVSIPSTLWDTDGNLIDCNLAMATFLGLDSKKEAIERYYEFTPEYQACGKSTVDICHEELEEIFATGKGIRKRWLHKIFGEIVPVEVTMTRIPMGDSFVCVCYVLDLRPIEEAMTKEREAHEQAQLMLDNAPIGITLFDKGLNTITSNKEAWEMYGTTETLEYEQMAQTMPETQPDGRNSMQVFILGTQKAMESGYYRTEIMCQKLDGTPMPTEITWASVNYKGETVIVEYALDLTARKEAEKREREAFEKIQQILDLSPSMINEWNKDLKMTKTNKRAIEWYKVETEQEYIDRFTTLAPEFQPCGTPTAQKAIELVKEAFENEAVSFEWMTETADGEPMPIWVKLVRSSDDEDAIVYAFTSDLREIKKMEAQLREKEMEVMERESREYIDALFAASPMFIKLWDEDINLIDCNDKVCELFGIDTKEEFLNNYSKYNPEFQACGRNSVELYSENIKIGFEQGHVKFDWIHLDANGKEVPIEVAYIRIFRKGKPFLIGYNFDLRDIKKAEAERHLIEVAEESNRAKSAFLARMSHEIRTPITAVMGISEIELQNPNLSERTWDSFTKIHNSANLLLSIVNDILDLSKIEVGKMELAKNEYDVASFVVDTASIHAGFASSKGIKYNVHVDENLPARLIGDALRIGQIVNNIMSNAFKYTLEGSVDLIFARLEDDEQDGAVTLQISITDTGLGMTPEQIHDLDNEYTRYHERNYRFIEGTGLGMPIVYNLIKLMGATIKVESAVNIGTTVVVSIPQQMAGDEVLGSETAENLEQFKDMAALKKFTFEPESMPYGRVLVVDDVEANLYVAKGLLAFYDIEVETCTNGFDALAKIKRGEFYDIIFMDYMMPGMTGTECLHQIRDFGYWGVVVALTANAMIGAADEFMKEGFNAFVSKPIQTKQLNTVLTKFIRDKQPPEVIEAARAAKAKRPAVKMGISDYQRDPSLLMKLRADFARMHKGTFEAIQNAIDSGDIEMAHRLAHTIKGAAGLLHEDALALAAKQVEQVLAENNVLTNGQLSDLKAELEWVLANIGEVLPVSFADTEYVNDDVSLALLGTIEPLVASMNVACLDMLDDIRKIPQSELLCSQIEDFDFSAALKTLREMKNNLGGEVR